MTARHAVVSGGSIAGLSTAFWLRRVGWRVTLIERAPGFRDGGQNVDVRGVAHEVLDRMGLTETVRVMNTTETGTVIVDGAGRIVAELPSDGRDGATAELEILRGDLARVIADALDPAVEFVYGDHVISVDEHPGQIGVALASGRTLDADLLVVAEGVRSQTRGLVFDDIETDELGITMAFGTIPRTADDDSRWRWYNAPGGRQVHLRPDNHGTTRAILAYAPDDGGLVDVPLPDALRRLRFRFADAGWQAERVLDGFDTSEDLYIDRLAQVRSPTWHRGRVCLVGDAAWCVTPLAGGGASLALTGGYVLAAHLGDGGDMTSALTAFERWMRPLVDDVQKLPPALRQTAYPRTRAGLALRNLLMRAMTSKPVAPLLARLTAVADTDRSLPELPSR